MSPFTSLPPSALAESTKLHLLAVTADGRRVYFTTCSNLASLNSSGLSTLYHQPSAGASGDRPAALTAVHVRAALPHAGLVLGRIAAADLTRSAGSNLGEGGRQVERRGSAWNKLLVQGLDLWLSILINVFPTQAMVLNGSELSRHRPACSPPTAVTAAHA